MSRRPDPDRIVTAWREALLARIRSAGLPSEHAVGLLREVEPIVLARGVKRSEKAFWDAASTIVDERIGRRGS